MVVVEVLTKAPLMHEHETIETTPHFVDLHEVTAYLAAGILQAFVVQQWAFRRMCGEA